MMNIRRSCLQAFIDVDLTDVLEVIGYTHSDNIVYEVFAGGTETLNISFHLRFCIHYLPKYFYTTNYPHTDCNLSSKY